jgi:hypothetical protein
MGQAIGSAAALRGACKATRDATIARFSTQSDGIQDRLIPVNAARDFHAAIPGLKLIVYPKPGTYCRRRWRIRRRRRCGHDASEVLHAGRVYPFKTT